MREIKVDDISRSGFETGSKAITCDSRCREKVIAWITLQPRT